MDTSGFSNSVHALQWENASRGFQLLDLYASFEFKSTTSVSFSLGYHSDTLADDDGIEEYWGEGVIFNVVGRLDVHHPCEGHIKTQLLIMLPDMDHKRFNEIVAVVFKALTIPHDETCEALFVSPEQQQIRVMNATDRNGMSDRIY